MYTINDMVKELQAVDVNSRYNKYMINTIDVLKSLKDYEITEFEATIFNADAEEVVINCDCIDESIQKLAEYGFIDFNYGYSENSYNWSSPLTHDLHWFGYKGRIGDIVYIVISAHLYGDARCNYTDDILLKFDNYYQFLNILSENNLYHTETVDGIKYYVDVDIFSDTFNVESETHETFTIYAFDTEDVINEIKNH